MSVALSHHYRSWSFPGLSGIFLIFFYGLLLPGLTGCGCKDIVETWTCDFHIFIATNSYESGQGE